jgi:hypothetical protein
MAKLDQNPSKLLVDARRERREARQRLIYSQLHNALDTTDLPVVKTAFTYKNPEDDVDSRPLTRDRHPGDSAIELVHSLLSQFRISGDTRLRYSGMDRKAGRGGHGMTDGTVFVDAELRPLRGQTVYCQFPIIVKNARMQVPGVMVVGSVPTLICQSAFDDLMKTAEVTQDEYLSNFDPRQHVAPKSQKEGGSSLRSLYATKQARLEEKREALKQALDLTDWS